MTDKSIKLTQQLEITLNMLLNLGKKYKGLGSVNFWYDEYGASLGVCQWLIYEQPWGISQDNNIDLSDFDVFDSKESDEFKQVIIKFFEAPKTLQLLDKHPLRKGFQSSISSFDPPEFIYKSSPFSKGVEIEAPNEEESINIVASAISDKLNECQKSSLIKISISSECEAISLTYSTETAQGELASDRFSDDSWNVGLALTHICQSGEKCWLSVCEKLIAECAFLEFPKCTKVVLYLIADYEHAFACLFDNHNQTLRLLNSHEKYDYM